MIDEHAADEVLYSSEVDGGGPAKDAVVCDTIFVIFVAKAIRTEHR